MKLALYKKILYYDQLDSPQASSINILGNDLM